MNYGQSMERNSYHRLLWPRTRRARYGDVTVVFESRINTRYWFNMMYLLGRARHEFKRIGIAADEWDIELLD